MLIKVSQTGCEELMKTIKSFLLFQSPLNGHSAADGGSLISPLQKHLTKKTEQVLCLIAGKIVLLCLPHSLTRQEKSTFQDSKR